MRVFFDKAHSVATRKYSQEKLLVRSFNIVFEDMIDQLLGDSKENLLDGSLKDQEDDKRVDHIYKDSALLPDSDIYYIGDSKYYIDGNGVKGSAWFKHSHPLCVECKKQGKLTQATVVDHIVPHRGDQKLFWDESNWQPLCKPCHDKKTWNEDNNPTYKF